MKRKKRSNKKAIIAVAIAVLLIAIIIINVLGKQEDKPIPVILDHVQKRTIIQSVTATGKIQPATKIKISSEVSGEIINLPVAEGDYVKKGTLLVKINPAILESQLEQYNQMLNVAKADESAIKVQLLNYEIELNRTKELFQKNFASKQELDKAQATYDATLANYNAALSRTKSSEASLQQI